MSAAVFLRDQLETRFGTTTTWAQHILEAMRDAGFVVARRARLEAFMQDCVTHGDMTPAARDMLRKVLAAEAGAE